MGVIILRFILRRGDVPERPHQALAVVLGDPFKRRILHVLPPLPRPEMMDNLRLVEPVNRLREGVVVRGDAAAKTRFDAGLQQQIRVADGEILRPAIAVRAERPVERPIVQCLLHRV